LIRFGKNENLAFPKTSDLYGYGPCYGKLGSQRSNENLEMGIGQATPKAGADCGFVHNISDTVDFRDRRIKME